MDLPVIVRIAGCAVRAALALTVLLGLTLALPVRAQIAFKAASWATINYTNNVFYQGSGSAASAASGNVTPALPYGWQPGDFFLAAVSSRDNVAATMPSGWTLLNEGGGAGGQQRATIFWKRAAAGDGAPTVTHAAGGRVIARIYGFRGVDLASPFDAANSFTSSGADLTTEAGAITTANSSRLVFIAGIGAQSTAAGSLSGSSPWTLIGVSSTGGAGDGASIQAHYSTDLRPAGAQAALSLARADSAESHGAQIALRVGTTLPVAKPAGTVANDVLVASLAYSASTVVDTAPTGWTLVRRTQNSDSVLAVYTRVAGASEPAQYTWALGGTTGASIGIQAFSGVDPASPIDVENGQTTAFGLSHASPSVATTVANAMLVTSHAYASGNTWSPPSGMTESVDIAALPVPHQQGGSLETSYVLQAAAGATGTKTATVTNTNFPNVGHAHILVLKPGAPAGPSVYFIHADHLNTPRLITDMSGTAVWRWDNNDPFGANAPDENPSGLGNFTCNLRLPGQYFDKETNLHYNYFRDYDPAIGRYVQSDPIGLRGGINTYGYVSGNPLSYADPMGLARWGCKAVDSTGVGYQGDIKVCRYECNSNCYPRVTVDARGWKSAGGSHCFGQEVRTQTNRSGVMSDNPVGSPKYFVVDTDGIAGLWDFLRYPSELVEAIKATEKLGTVCCR